jgi:hypothetical protein
LVADLVIRAWQLVLVTFVWPMAPGLMALDAAWRARRSPASS